MPDPAKHPLGLTAEEQSLVHTGPAPAAIRTDPVNAEDDLVERVRALLADLGDHKTIKNIGGWSGTASEAAYAELRDLGPELAAALEAVRSTRDGEIERWQPIETAPKDGTWVDLWAAERERYVSQRVTDCIFQDGKWMHHRTVYDDEAWCGGRDLVPVFNVTNWRSRPNPPRQALNQGTDNVG